MLLLDGFEIRREGEVSPVAPAGQRLVAFLALHERSLERAYIAGTLWPDTSQSRANASLRSTLRRVRRSDPSLIESAGNQLRLAAGTRVDVREVLTLARLLADGPTTPGDAARQAFSLTGELLPAWYESWVVVERERLRQVQHHNLKTMCVRLAEGGRYGQAIDAGLSAVAAEPLRESAHRALIRAHLAHGNKAEALGQYRTYRDLLHHALAVEPSSHMEELIGSVRTP